MCNQHCNEQTTCHLLSRQRWLKKSPQWIWPTNWNITSDAPMNNRITIIINLDQFVMYFAAEFKHECWRKFFFLGGLLGCVGEKFAANEAQRDKLRWQNYFTLAQNCSNLSEKRFLFWNNCQHQANIHQQQQNCALLTLKQNSLSIYYINHKIAFAISINVLLLFFSGHLLWLTKPNIVQPKWWFLRWKCK